MWDLRDDHEVEGLMDVLKGDERTIRIDSGRDDHVIDVLHASGTGPIFRVNCSCGEGLSPKGPPAEREALVEMWAGQHLLMVARDEEVARG